jgi:hypothetical protein
MGVFFVLLQDSRRIAGYDCIRRNVFGNDGSGADRCIFSHRNSAKQSRAGSNRCAAFDQSILAIPVAVRFRKAGHRGSSRIPIVNEDHPVPDKYFSFDLHSFTNEGVTGNLAARSDARAFLDLNERPNASFVSDLASIQIHESIDADITPELYIRGDELMD